MEKKDKLLKELAETILRETSSYSRVGYVMGDEDKYTESIVDLLKEFRESIIEEVLKDKRLQR